MKLEVITEKNRNWTKSQVKSSKSLVDILPWFKRVCYKCRLHKEKTVVVHTKIKQFCCFDCL